MPLPVSQFLELLPFVAVVTDAEGIVVSGNASWLEQSRNAGRDGVLTCLDVCEICIGENRSDAQAAAGLIRGLLSSDRVMETFDYHSNRSEGPNTWFRMLVVRLDGVFGSRNGGLVILDIPLQGFARAAQTDNDAFLFAAMQRAFDTSPIVLLLLDHERRLLTFNQKARELMQRVWDEPIQPGDPLDDLASLGNVEYFQQCHARALRGERLDVVRQATLQGDSTIWLKLSYIPVETGGEHKRVLLSAVDLTEKRASEARLAHTHRLETLGRLSLGVTHDFNNLLTAIMVSADMLAAPELYDREELEEAVSNIQSAAATSRELTRQQLAFARSKPRPRQNVNLDELVIRVLRIVRSQTLDSDVQTDLKSDRARISAETTELEQVVMNLVLNAADAGATQIQVSTDVANEHWQKSEDRTTLTKLVRLRVTDNGPGIPRAAQSQIFDPFFSTRDEGTGLGLAICSQVVREVGGQIQVVSEPGGGTQFDVFLPICNRADSDDSNP